MNRWTSLCLAIGGLTAFTLVDSAIKGTLILFLAAVVCVWLRKDSAATRHFVWTIAMCLLVAMPVLSLVLPQWRILPRWIYSEPQTSQQMSWPAVSSQQTFVDAAATNLSAFPNRLVDFPADMDGDESDVSNDAPPLANMGSSDVSRTIDPGKEAATQIPEWISFGWLIGCGVLLARLSIAAVMLRRSERRCLRLNGERQGVSPPCRLQDDIALQQPDESDQNPRLAPCGSWGEDASETRRADALPLAIGQGKAQRLMFALERSKRAMGLSRTVTMLVDPNRSIPIVWGLWRTRLQLPKEAVHWNDEQLQSVLLHELAHVRRRDLFVLTMTQVACALHWFNPLVWIVAWRMHLERERACDDLVLNTGIRASSYAEHLLNVATRLTSSRWTQACGLAMARNSPLHGRLSALLNEKQNRRSVTTALAIGFVLTATALAAPMAMLRGSDESKQEGSKTGAGVFNQISETPIPFTEAFEKLAWGEFHESGLRAAVVIDLEGNSVPLGTVVKRKLVLHNRGSQPLTIRLASIHHQQLGRTGVFRPVIMDYKPTRHRYNTEVPANSCIGLDACGIGFGDDLTETQQLPVPALQRVSAVAGDSFATSAEVRLLIGNQPDNGLALEQVSLKAGFLKLSVLPWKPDAPRKVRTADTIGNYIVADGLRLYVDLDSKEADRFTARLVYSKSKPWESEPIWESDRIAVTWPFQFVWTRHSGTVWLAESSGSGSSPTRKRPRCRMLISRNFNPYQQGCESTWTLP